MAIYLDDVVQNGKKDICDYLKIQSSDIPDNRKQVFELTHKKKDADGRIRSKKSISGKPEYSVYVHKLGREVKVRYAITQSKIKDGLLAYQPSNLTIEPAEDGSVIVNDPLQFIFWFLRPMCRQSPFRKANQKFHYEYQDNDATAKAEIERDAMLIDALNIVIGENRWSESKLRQLAKGLNIGGVDDMTGNVVQKKLKDLAYKDPIAFYNQANSREVIFSGKIQEAMDKGILHVESMNGMRRWYLGQDEILPLQYGEDDVNALKAYLSANWHLHAETIQASLDGRTVKSNLENPEMDKYFEATPKVEKPADMSADLADAVKGKEIGIDVPVKTQEDLIAEMEADPILRAKMERLSVQDPEDKRVNWRIRAQIKESAPYFEALKVMQEPV